MSTRWIEETFHPHWRVRLAASKVLHEVKTDHQHLVIFENETWGTVLMLDGVCQLTTSDEFVYHEMMAHVPLMALSKPRRVLVVGGGDGGVMREVLKHPTIEKATLCEIDRSVVDLSLEHYPQIAGGCFDDPRMDLVIADGLKYVAETKEKFDAIIVDLLRAHWPLGRPSHARVLRRLQTRAARGRHSGHAERSAIPGPGSPGWNHQGLRRSLLPSRPLFLHATLLFRRAIRAELGLRRRRSGRRVGQEDGSPAGQARHCDPLLDAIGPCRCVRPAGLRPEDCRYGLGSGRCSGQGEAPAGAGPTRSKAAHSRRPTLGESRMDAAVAPCNGGGQFAR